MDVFSPAHKLSKLGGMDEVETPETPRTPRTMTVLHNSCTSPCSARCCGPSTPPPLVPKWQLPEPPLLKALRMKSEEQVHIVLKQTPEAVQDIFWDHDCEPPLCCAVRLKCSVAIVQILLEHGASTEAEDKWGRTPIEIVDQMAPWENQLEMDYGAELTTSRPGLYTAFERKFVQVGLHPYAGYQWWRQEVTDLLVE